MVGEARQVAHLLVDDLARLRDLREHRDHRQHDAKLAPAGSLQQRADLGAQQSRAVEGEADGAPAERRIFLMRDVLEIGQHLVAADVDGAEGDRLVARDVEHVAVEPLLRLGAREGGGDHELQLGAEQADAGRARFGELRQVDRQAGIHHQVDLDAVLALGRLLAQFPVEFLPARPEAHLLGIGRFEVGLRAQVDRALVAVDDDGVAVFRHRDGALGLAGDGNAHGARHDDDVAGDGAVLQHQAAQLLARIVEQFGSAHRAGDDDGVLGQCRGDIVGTAPHQHAQQAVGEVVEIAHPLAQIGIGHVHHARAHVALHLLDRRLGRQAVAHRLFQPAHPALVVGEHAVGFEHGAMLALEGDVAARQHVVDRQPSEPSACSSRRSSSSLSSLNRLVTTMRGSCSTTWPSPTPSLSDRPVKLAGRRRSSSRPGRVSRASSPAAIISASTMAAVSSASTSSSRYCRWVRFCTTSTPSVRPALSTGTPRKERVDLLAGLRQVGEGRMLLRVRQVERAGRCGDGADEALAEPQLRQVDRFAVQTFGGVELEHRIGAQHVERADLGHHVLGDVVHDAIEPLLRLERLRHELAEPFQQNARA